MSINLSATAVSVEHTLHHALDGILVLDRNREFVLFNDACEKITGYKSDELVNKDCLCCEVLDCHDEYGRPLRPALCPVTALFDGTARAARQPMRIRRKDGSATWVETVYTPINDSAGEVAYVMGVVRDVPDAKGGQQDLAREPSELREQIDQPTPEPGPAADRVAAGGGETLHAAWESPQHTSMAGVRDPSQPCASGPGRGSLLLDPILAQVERQTIRQALRAASWQRNRAAQFMGISRSRLYRRMEALDIDPNEHS